MHSLHVTLTLILISSSIDMHFSLPLRVIGGSVVTIEKHSYQLSLLKQNNHICGAVIINKLWALSAADCVKGVTPSDISLRAGSTTHNKGGIIHPVTQIIIHPNYNQQNKDYNIALIKVTKQFDAKAAKPITMATEGSIIKAGLETIVTGWGLLSSGGTIYPEKLQKATMPTRDQDECKIANGNYFTDRTFCAGYTTGGADICTGDIGGPLTYQDKLLGVASLSKSCGNTGGGFSLFTSIPKLRGWIKQMSGV